MKILTLLIEVKEEEASAAFLQMLEECAEGITHADKETLTIHMRKID